MAQRNYRDPLHNIISLDESASDDLLIIRLIDTPEFQRLRRIKQLGLAMFTYQGAEHSRFSHSLGVMHLMTRALYLLSSHQSINDQDRVVGRTSALLHDLGHGPFSHVMEKVFHFHHEDWSRRVVLDPNTQVNRLLREFDNKLPERVASVYDHSYSPPYIAQLVSSQLDCDRMDYLLRDSLMTGAKYGIYDLEWVLHALNIDQASNRIYVEAKGLYAVEEYLHARYYMFRQVYFHRTLRSAEAVLVSALNRARELIRRDDLGFRMRGSVFEKMLVGEEVSVAEYLELDDTDVTFHLKQWTHDRDPVLSDLSSRFIHRRLFKALDLTLSASALEQFWDEARELVERAGLNPEYYLVMDRATDVPYYGYYSPTGVDPDRLIYIETGVPGEAVREISDVSAAVRAMRGYGIDRVCFPYEVSREMLQLVSRIGTETQRQSAT